MSRVVWCSFALMAPGALLALLAFRKLVDIEFARHHEEWLIDGKPVGGPKSRQAASFWRSGLSTRRAYNTWLVTTPEWARQSPDAMAALRQFRIWTVVMMIGVLAAIGAALLTR